MLPLRTLLRHPVQFVLMTLSIALGVAVMVGIDLANASAERAFELSTSAITGRATHAIVGSNGVDEELYVQLRTDPGWREQIESTPTVREFLVSPQLGQITFTLLEIDPFTEAPFRSYLGGEQGFAVQSDTPLLTQPGAILLSKQTAERYGLIPCTEEIRKSCQLKVTITGKDHDVYLVGVLEPTNEFSRRALDSIVITPLRLLRTTLFWI